VSHVSHLIIILVKNLIGKMLASEIHTIVFTIQRRVVANESEVRQV